MATGVNPQENIETEVYARNFRRKQLIDATISAIAEHGLSRITLAKVASCADMSPGIVNFYFKSKEQLLLATLREIAAEFHSQIRATIDTTDDPARTLLLLIDAFFDPVLFNVDKAAVWSAFWGESQARADYLKICGDKDAEFCEIVHGSFVELCNQEANEGMDTLAAARGFEGLLDGYWQELLCGPGAFDVAAAKKTCTGYLKNLFPRSFGRVSHSAAEASLRTMMAPWTYSNREFFQLEVERIFKRSWLLAGHVSELEKPGDFVTFDAVNERAIIVRGADGKLRGFHNVCRHRGGRIVRADEGNCNKAIVCPFHGWTYNLDGSLKNVPAINTFPNLDKASHGLVPLELEVWNGFVFLRFGGDGESVGDLLRTVEDKISPYRPQDVRPLWPAVKITQPVNWKVVHDIDNEGYHVPIGHPGLHALFGNSYRDELEDGVGCSYGIIQDKIAKQWSVGKYQKLLPHYSHLPEANQRLWFYCGLFPNAGFEFHPDCIAYYMTLPVAPDQTVYIERYFALPDDRPEARAARYLSRRINDRVGLEDQSFVDWVQQGLRSSAFPEGTLSSIEQGVSDFHQEIQSLLPVGRLAREPAAGTVETINDDMERGRSQTVVSHLS